MERIGIYGGTFNPPHVGHVQAARQVVKTLCLDRVLMIPTGTTPHKQLPEDSPTPVQRLEMLRLAVEDLPGIEVSDLELKREGTSYTYQTVEQLKELYPDSELVFIMGTDMFLSFLDWKNPDRITQNASLAVLNRGQTDEQQAIQQQKALMEHRGIKVELANNDILSISSTDLRRLLAFDCADPFLPGGVADYIRANGLYGTSRSYVHLPMEDLERVVISLLKPNRVAHVLGCRNTAVELARRWGADETDASRAGILHDITKALDGSLQLTLCREYGILLDKFSSKNPKTLHALTGSLVAKRIFGENPAVVDAIRFHTTGKADMCLLEKIIYVADYMEPNRDFPGVKRLRELAFSDIDAALKLGLQMTLDLLKKQGREISPESAQALRYLERRRE